MLVHTHGQRERLPGPSRVWHHLRFQCPNLWLASSEIGEDQGRCLESMSRPRLRFTAVCGDTHIPGWVSCGQFG